MKIIGKREYKLLISFFEYLPITLRPNALYNKKDISKTIVRASIQNSSIEASSRWLNGISGDTVLYHLKKLSIRDMKEWVSFAIGKQITKAKKKHRIANKACIAIDFTKIPYYGEDNVWITHSKPERGTKLFLCVITLHIVVKGQRLTVCVLPVNIFHSTEELVKELIEAAKQHFQINYALLDRYFESIDCINMLKKTVKFIMPKKRNGKTVRVMEEMFLSDIERQEFTIEQGNRSAMFDLVIYETDEDLVGFITNMQGSAEWIADTYRKRWGIETGYFVKNNFRARTSSENFAVRYLLLFTSFIIYNFWVFVNCEEHKSGKLGNTAKDICVYIARIMDSEIT